MFNYGHKTGTDEIRTSWGKPIQYIGNNYGQDINNELQNKIKIILIKPVHTLTVMAKHTTRETIVNFYRVIYNWLE